MRQADTDNISGTLLRKTEAINGPHDDTKPKKSVAICCGLISIDWFQYKAFDNKDPAGSNGMAVPQGQACSELMMLRN